MNAKRPGNSRRPNTKGAGKSKGPRSAPRSGPRANQGSRKDQAARRERVNNAPPADIHDPDGVRLQKLLAEAGWGSRRACEVLISGGRVTVDGQIVAALGVRVDPGRRTIHVDGTRVILDSTKVYLALNKPLGVVSSMSDDRGRANLGDYVGRRKERLFHVGRLDADTEGLLLLTNDGELANRLQHPSYGVTKTYVAKVPGPIARDLGRQLRDGVELEDGTASVDSFKLLDSLPRTALVEVVLHEGRKHIVRRLLEAVGHPVQALTRTDVGPIQLGDLRPGKTRPLTRDEVGALYRAAGL